MFAQDSINVPFVPSTGIEAVHERARAKKARALSSHYRRELNVIGYGAVRRVALRHHDPHDADIAIAWVLLMTTFIKSKHPWLGRPSDLFSALHWYLSPGGLNGSDMNDVAIWAKADRIQELARALWQLHADGDISR